MEHEGTGPVAFSNIVALMVNSSTKLGHAEGRVKSGTIHNNTLSHLNVLVTPSVSLEKGHKDVNGITATGEASLDLDPVNKDTK